MSAEPPIKRLKIDAFRANLPPVLHTQFDELMELFSPEQAPASSPSVSASEPVAQPIPSRALTVLELLQLSLTNPRGKHNISVLDDHSLVVTTVGTASKPPNTVLSIPSVSITGIFVGEDRTDCIMIVVLSQPVTIGKTQHKAIVAKLARKHKLKDLSGVSITIDEHHSMISDHQAEIASNSAPSTLQLFAHLLASALSTESHKITVECSTSVFKSARTESCAMDCYVGRDEGLALMLPSSMIVLSKSTQCLPLSQVTSQFNPQISKEVSYNSDCLG